MDEPEAQESACPPSEYCFLRLPLLSLYEKEGRQDACAPGRSLQAHSAATTGFRSVPSPSSYLMTSPLSHTAAS